MLFYVSLRFMIYETDKLTEVVYLFVSSEHLLLYKHVILQSFQT